MAIAVVFLPLLGAIIAGFFGRLIGDRGAQLVRREARTEGREHAAGSPGPE